MNEFVNTIFHADARDLLAKHRIADHGVDGLARQRLYSIAAAASVQLCWPQNTLADVGSGVTSASGTPKSQS